ncbi:MAG: hypothetical protein AAF721_11800 [Myxococcota bacterium]
MTLAAALVLPGCDRSPSAEPESAPAAPASATAPATTSTPRSPTGLFVGDEGGCAVGSDTKLHCWGRFEHLHPKEGFPVPARPDRIFGDASLLCVLDDEGQARCTAEGKLEVRAQGESLQQIALGRDEIYGLRADGQLIAWTLRDSEDDKPWALEGFEDVEAIAATYDKVCARKKSQAVVCAMAPERERKPNVFEVEAWKGAPLFGGRAQCAVLDGVVSCLPRDGTWPDENEAELFQPTTVERAGQGAVKVGSGQSFSCALLDDAKVRCWDSGKASPQFPHPEAGLADVVDLAVGDANACARMRSGEVKCWGFFVYRDPASPLRIDKPTDVAGLANIVELAVAQSGSCARDNAGAVWCWGSGNLLLGLEAEEGWHAKPVKVPKLVGAKEIVAAATSMCARDSDGRVRCWGVLDGGRGARTIEPLQGATDLFAGPASQSICGRMPDGGLVCNGGLTSAHDEACYRPAPDDAWRPPDGLRSVAVADRFACGLDGKGAVYCWGVGRRAFPSWPQAQLGKCSASRLEGVSGATRVEVNESGGCVLSPKGTTCFGDGYNDPRPSGSGDASVVSIAPRKDVVSLTVSDGVACDVTAAGSARCWGSQRRFISDAPSETEDPVALDSLGELIDLGVGHDFACALRKTGAVACRGDNRFGTSGAGSEEKAKRLVPVTIAGLP